MNPSETIDLHVLKVHVFQNNTDMEQAKLDGTIGDNDLVITPDTGENILQQMTDIASQVESAAARAESSATSIEAGISNGTFIGATFTPSISNEGVLSWSNDKALTNPEPVNIRGPQGETGPQGLSAIASTCTGTLISSQWLDRTQSVAAPGVTPDSIVIVSPTPESFSLYSASGMRANVLLDGYVAFTYDSLPGENITVNILILNGGDAA